MYPLRLAPTYGIPCDLCRNAFRSARKFTEGESRAIAHRPRISLQNSLDTGSFRPGRPKTQRASFKVCRFTLYREHFLGRSVPIQSCIWVHATNATSIPMLGGLKAKHYTGGPECH